MKRILAGLLTVTLMAFAGAAARADRFEDVIKKGVVRVAVPLDVPPFGSQNQNREPEGFDVDLGICDYPLDLRQRQNSWQYHSLDIELFLVEGNRLMTGGRALD